MRGSVRKRNKTWSYIIDVGKVDGKRKQKEKGGFKTKKDAELALSEALNEMNKYGSVFEFKKITVDELFDEYIKYDCLAVKKPSTVQRQRSIYINHIKTLVGYKYIYNVGHSEIEEYLHKLLTNHSAAFVRSVYSFLLVLFNYALKKDYIKSNPIDKITPPELPLKEVVIYSNKEIELLYNRLEKTNLQLPFFIAYCTGIRSGECFALRWQDIDLDNNIIHINKQLQEVDKKWSFITTKTKKSNRDIKINDALKNYLINHKSKQEQNKLTLGDYWTTNKVVDLRFGKADVIIVDDFINIKPDGHMMNNNSLKYLSTIAKTEFNIDFKFHNLRHTHASLLLQNGANIKYIQERLGHARIGITLDVYSHVTENSANEAMNILDKTFANIG